jgi:hypothetical protein
MTKDEMKNLFIEDGIELTDNLNEAIFLFDNGLMISGEYYDGVRGTDHRTLLNELDNSATYEELHQNYKVARLVPESMTALVSGLQLDNDKTNMLKDYGYTIENY